MGIELPEPTGEEIQRMYHERQFNEADADAEFRPKDEFEHAQEFCSLYEYDAHDFEDEDEDDWIF